MSKAITLKDVHDKIVHQYMGDSMEIAQALKGLGSAMDCVGEQGQGSDEMMKRMASAVFILGSQAMELSNDQCEYAEKISDQLYAEQAAEA
jgi:hypothetical protein